MKTKGFTLIELVVVIVILGILAATALPKFIDVQTDAETAAVNGVAGALGSATAVNYGASITNPARATAVTDCATAQNTMINSGVTGYSFALVSACAGGPPKTGTCKATRIGGNASISAVATITCTN